MVTENTRLSQNASAECRVQPTAAGAAAMQQGHCRGCSRVVSGLQQGCSQAPAIPAVLLLVSRCMHSCRRSGSNAAVAAVQLLQLSVCLLQLRSHPRNCLSSVLCLTSALCCCCRCRGKGRWWFCAWCCTIKGHWGSRGQEIIVGIQLLRGVNVIPQNLLHDLTLLLLCHPKLNSDQVKRQGYLPNLQIPGEGFSWHSSAAELCRLLALVGPGW